MSLNNAMKIYSNTNKGGIFFEPSTVTPKLIGTCTAEIKSSRPDRVVIRRTDQIVQSTGEFRPIFGSFNPYRVQNEDGVDLIETLGYTIQQVVDYLNAEFNDFSQNSLEFGEAINFFRDATNTSIFNSQGDAFDVNAVRTINNNGSISIVNYNSTITYYNDILFELVTINDEAAGNDVDSVVNELNALFTVNAIGGGTETNYITIVLDSGTAATLETGSAVSSSNNFISYNTGSGVDSWVITDETINDNGEYFRFAWKQDSLSDDGLAYLGLVDVSSSAYTDFQTSGVDPIKGGGTFKFGFQYDNNQLLNLSNTNDGVGEFYQIASLNHQSWLNSPEYQNFRSGSAILMRVGINENGYGIIGYYDTSESGFVDILRTSQLIGDGDFAFLYNPTEDGAPSFMDEGGVTPPDVFEIDQTNTIQSYYYIESPDNNFHYPLFATATEAEAYDSTQGGSGNSNTQLFPDDSIPGRQWHSPATGYTSNASTAPSTVGITWNIITTQADNLFAPSSFNDITYVFDEGDPFNIQIDPVGNTSWTTAVSPTNGATFGSLTFANFQGTCPTVLGDNVTNPSDDYTWNVVRTNNFGSSTGVLTLTVLNQTSPTSSITGFTHIPTSTALPAPNTLGDGSVVNSDETLAESQRFIIEESYIESNVLPNLTAAGDKYLIGNLNAGADVSTLEVSDYDFVIAWEYIDNSSHKVNYYRDGVSQYSYTINSKTDAFYDYGIEVQSPDVYVFGCNVGDINTQPSPKFGGMLSNTFHFTSSDNTAPLTISFGNIGSNSTYDLGGIEEIVTPAPSNWIQVSKSVSDYFFDDSGSLPTLQAGTTYRFLMGDVEYLDISDSTGLGATDIFRFTENGTSEYDMTNVTRSGAVGSANAFYEFTVPQDVPPLSWYTDASGISQDNGVTIAGSTYSESITGITKEGPAANQTGTNVMDAGEFGWISLDEQLSAGERLVLDDAFFSDFFSEVQGNNTVFAIGLKGDNWVNTREVNSNGAAAGGGSAGSETFKGNLYIVGIWSSGASNVTMWVGANNQLSNSMYMNTPSLWQTTCAFLEITSDGNNIRAAVGYNGNAGVTQGDESTKAFADWLSYKGETGDQGYGITSKDVMMSFWTFDGGAIDGDEIDWTGLSEVNVPAPRVANDTTWTKAVDFNGGSENTKQGTNSSDWNSTQPITMGGLAIGVAANASSNKTSNATTSRPWATSIVFKTDRHNSNQHIWNQGEGAGNGDDNIYLRISSGGILYLGWGREGTGYNECIVSGQLSPFSWYGVYIAHKGTRLSGTDATASNLADAFDIRVMSSIDSFNGVGNNQSVTSRWWATGVRMDRSVTGDFTIGGRGSNRTFHGKVASCVVTTLKTDTTMPTDTEIKNMITDPVRWITDYKLGGSYRYPTASSTYSNFQLNGQNEANSTQVWLMGNVASDGYSTLKNYIRTADTIKTPMIMTNMVSNDIETVTITGLTI